METNLVNPNVGNFVKSLRDVGYNFEIAVADILDNCITAGATTINIYTVSKPDLIFGMLDDGNGMSEKELVEAMRLATKDPDDERGKNDLGRFGLGLKTASFSQCKKLTVVTKENKIISAAQWDLEYLMKKNEWLLKRPSINSISNMPLLNDLKKLDHGTLVIWEELDRYEKDGLSQMIDKLRKHLSLVFHRYLEGAVKGRKLKLFINDNSVKPFNPFNVNSPATQELASEKIKYFDHKIIVQPFILPHHSKVSQQEYEQYATEEGYTKSQGFYLYRGDRLLIYGTWWGLNRIKDAHKLVRIKVDISNDQDFFWGIDIKKATASPCIEIMSELKRIINQIIEKGSRPFTGRGRKIEDKTMTRFWRLVPYSDGIRFALNEEHPILNKLISELSGSQNELFKIYLKGLQAYLPLDSIQAQLQENPHKVRQEDELSDDELVKLIKRLKESGVDNSYLESLLKTELFNNRKELLNHGNKQL